jgi:hypothetical protein
MYLVSIYDRSMIKASIVNHPFKEIKSVLHSRITSSGHLYHVMHLVEPPAEAETVPFPLRAAVVFGCAPS